MKTLILLLAITIGSTISTYAQELLKFNEKGEAVIKTRIPAKSQKTYTISGKDFKVLLLKQVKGNSVTYTLSYKKKVIQKGETSKKGCTIKNTQQGDYILTFINNQKGTQEIEVTVTAAGGGSDI